MSIIPDRAQPPRQHAQQQHAALLAQLLTFPLPEMHEWTIGGPDHPMNCDAAGQLAAARPLIVKRLQLHPCAAALDSPTWHVIRYKHASGGKLAVRGTFHGMRVEMWTSLDDDQLDVDVNALAEVDEQPVGGAR